MPRLIDDLSALSDNAPLFEHLRTGGGLKTLPDARPGAPRGRKPELLAAIRAALVSALRGGDSSALVPLVETGDVCARVTVLGELILTLHALADGGHPGPLGDLFREAALGLALGLAADLEADPPQDADDEELLLHGTALREWTHLFARHYRALGRAGHEAELLLVRARATNTTLSAWPHLVGPAMVEAGLALETIGKAEMAKQCYEGVRLDVRNLLDRAENPDWRFETAGAVFWLQRACEERVRLVPDDAGAARDLDAVRELRRARGYADAPSEPRFGPIARTYLDRVPYLARIVHDLRTGYDPGREEESAAAVCAKYGCNGGEVAFYLSAMGSYEARQLLRGVNMMYDEPHLEVFAAIELLDK